MRFLFINPKRKLESRNIWRFITSSTPPLGLAMLAAVLEKHGHSADIIDAVALGLETPQILPLIDPRTDVVGITATTPEIDWAGDCARQIRAAFPGMNILMGGVHPTVFHEALASERVCDMVIRGEGEAAILSIAERQPLDRVPNLTWRRDDGAIMVNPQSSQYADLDMLPFPAYEKLPMTTYRSALGAALRTPSIGMITSRGCPGTCTFCYSGMFGTKIRFMSPERVIENIRLLKATYGIREISFYDDTFTAHRDRVKALCNLILSEKLDITWSCFARVDSVSEELLRLMKRSGCHQICYGLESSDESVLKAMNKRIDAEKVSRALAWTRRAGIDIRGAFMLGSPGDTDASMQRTIAYAKNAGVQFAIFNITTPFPGTALFDSAEKNGMLKHKDWKLYDLAHPILELPTVSAATVQHYYYKAYKEFYLRPLFIIKHALSIRNVHKLTTYIKALGGIFSLLKKQPGAGR